MPNRGYFTTYEQSKGTEILSFIHEKYKLRLTLEDLVDHTGLTQKMLQRIVRQLTGFSIHQYQKQFRLTQAIEDFSTPDGMELKISQLARKHGYSSDKYFYRVFKQRTGFTPDEYRAKLEAIHTSRPE